MASNYKTFAQTPGVQSICPQACNLQGMFISAVTGTATVAIYDTNGVGTNVTIIQTFSPNITQCWYPMPCQTYNGLAVSVAATVNYTIMFD